MCVALWRLVALLTKDGFGEESRQNQAADRDENYPRDSDSIQRPGQLHVLQVNVLVGSRWGAGISLKVTRVEEPDRREHETGQYESHGEVADLVKHVVVRAGAGPPRVVGPPLGSGSLRTCVIVVLSVHQDEPVGVRCRHLGFLCGLALSTKQTTGVIQLITTTLIYFPLATTRVLSLHIGRGMIDCVACAVLH